MMVVVPRALKALLERMDFPLQTTRYTPVDCSFAFTSKELVNRVEA